MLPISSGRTAWDCELARWYSPDSGRPMLCLIHRWGDGDTCAHCCAREWVFCAALREEILHNPQQTMRRLSLAARQPILIEGEPADHAFVVMSGLVSTYKTLPDGRRQIIGLSMQGDLFGSLFEDSYCYSAEAVTRCEVYRFPIAQLGKLFERFPALEQRLLKALSDELSQAQATMLSLGRKNAPERVASFLVMLAHRAEHRGESANPIRLFLNRDEIGDYLGLNSGTVSRTFAQLARHGLIGLHRRRQVVLCRRDALERLADGTISFDDPPVPRSAAGTNG